MKKFILSIVLSMVLIMGMAITASAAPKTMPDGGVFDAEYYAANNPEVVSVVGTKEADLYNHYVQFGKAEGRLPYDPASVTSLGTGKTNANNSGAAQTGSYVLNTSTKKFHKPTCGSVKQMSDKNKKVVTSSRQEIIDLGYEPCKKCKP